MGTLSLSRKKNQKIIIGNDIEVEVTSIDRGAVTLGVSAPKSIRIDRAEVHDRRKTDKLYNPSTGDFMALLSKAQDYLSDKKLDDAGRDLLRELERYTNHAAHIRGYATKEQA